MPTTESPSSIRRAHVAKMLAVITAQQDDPISADFVLNGFDTEQLEQIAEFIRSFDY